MTSGSVFSLVSKISLVVLVITIEVIGASSGMCSVVLSPQTRANERIVAGNKLVDQQSWPEAIDAYRDAIELDPTAAAAFGNMGHVYSRDRKSVV